MSIHKDDKAHYFLEDHVEELDFTFILDKREKNQDLRSLFQSFSYPLFNWTKVEMEDYAAREGWSDIMMATWFCHTPHNGKSCGLCNPCRYTVEEGLEKRLTTRGLLRYRLRPIYDCIIFVKKAFNYTKRKILND